MFVMMLTSIQFGVTIIVTYVHECQLITLTKMFNVYLKKQYKLILFTKN